MGWTTCYNASHYKQNGWKMTVDRKACVDDLYTCENENRKQTVVKSTMVGRVWYGAVKIACKDGTERVTAGVCLTCGKWKDGTIWGYKDMEESMGPCYYDCPESILKLLTPTESSTANEWRKTCLAKRRQKSEFGKVNPPQGITIRYRGGWVLSSPEYRERNYYSGVRYHRSYSRVKAIEEFVGKHGTDEQKCEWNAIKAEMSAN